ncbi:DNA translocase FtsK [Salinispira pacifica]|uniref:Cell division protein FtsK n=1 Tax=Salinispira pacifica TaxID=1307761 RepID=V5WD34_9SPIO|nr:DNA translocase FtsK [Salinispira pacifica]AHC13702.1 Cell division protein FtsK [Salinispira pacifica]
MRDVFQSRVLGGILTVLGVYLLLSTAGAAVPALQAGFIIRLLALPGEFLYSWFFVMGFYPGIYLVYNGLLIALGQDSPRSLYVSSFAALPVISFAAFLRFLVDPGFADTLLASVMTESLGLQPSLYISGILSAALVLFTIRMAFLPELSAAPTEDNDVEDLEEVPQSLLPEPSAETSLFRADSSSRNTSAQNRAGDPVTAAREFLRTELSRYEPAGAELEDPGEYPVLTEDPGADHWRQAEDTHVEMGFDSSAETAEPQISHTAFGSSSAGPSNAPHEYSLEYGNEEAVEPEGEVIHLNLGSRFVDTQAPAPAVQDVAPAVHESGDFHESTNVDESNNAHESNDVHESNNTEDQLSNPASTGPFGDFSIDDHWEEEDESEDDAAGEDDEYAGDDDDLPVNEDLLPHTEEEPELNFSRKTGPYEIPIDGVLRAQSSESYWVVDQATSDQGEVLRNTLQEFGIEAEVTGIRKGPVITMFEILPAPGVKLNRIVNLADNIALSLAASSVRIVAPIPGKHAVGIEVPNKRRHLVTFSEILKEDEFMEGDHGIPVALGKDITGDAQIVDLTKMPHLLIAGATGAGKSVCVNSIISSVLYRRDPDEVKMILIDPKIVELKFYNDIPHLLTPVITDPKRAFQALQWCLYEMERRYSLLDAMAVRDVKSYNKKIVDKKIATTKLPYIVVVVDEFADLMATSGKELESTLARLAAMSRAVGIHLVLATQRPSTDVITGLIKANIPSRIAFMVASKVDSRIIIDSGGAEKLLGKGDMLFTSAWDPFPQRMQGAFLSEGEVETIVSHVKEMGSPDYIDDEIFFEEEESELVQGELDDPLMQKAIDIVCTANKASASYLQRRLSIGYNRAARLIEEMEDMGIVGPQNGSKPREILKNRDVM